MFINLNELERRIDMTQVIFFSRHEASSLMLEQLQEVLGQIELAQFEGTFSAFKGSPEGISFTEKLEVEGVMETFSHTIPVDAIIVMVAPPQLQIEVLNAIRFSGGKARLLQPLTNRVSRPDGSVEFQFVGLNEVHKVEIVTSRFSGGELAPAHERR